MRRRLPILFVAVFVLALGTTAFFSLRGEREPEYQGRKLSEWITLAGQPVQIMRPLGTPRPSDPNCEAICHIGTNAIPWLIKWMLYEQPGWQPWLEEKLGDSFVERLHFVDAVERRARGVIGFMALGEAAAPAVPALTAIVDDPARSTSSKEDAIEALSYAGPAAVPVLLKTMRKNGPKSWITLVTIRRLSDVHDLGTNQWEAGELLRAYVSGSEPGIASAAAYALGAHRLQPALSIPVLATQLDESNPVFVAAAYALARFGPVAQAALPKLTPWLTSQDLHVRAAATNAFAKIAQDLNGEAQRR